MWNLMGYQVVRTTTDKLSDQLNSFVEGWNVEQITHVGGRDWVIIASTEFDDAVDKETYRREDLGLTN